MLEKKLGPGNPWLCQVQVPLTSFLIALVRSVLSAIGHNSGVIREDTLDRLRQCADSAGPKEVTEKFCWQSQNYDSAV